MRFHTRLDTMEEWGGGNGPASFTSNATFVAHAHIYKCPNSIQHWQLRDLVSCVEDTNGNQQVYTVYGRHTVALDVHTEQSKVMQELNFSPTSMTTGEGFIAAGGTSSQLDVRSLDGSFSYRGHISGTVNNAMHIAKDQTGKAQLFVANNDRTIKVFSLPTMDRTCVIPTETAINYAALSPDATRLIAVGDTTPLYLFRAAPAGWVAAGSWRGGKDAGMCCAWSPCGNLVAAAFQDGLIALWDSRSGQVESSLKTRLAARCVKIAPGPADLLAVAEHQGAAHLVDLRNTSEVQSLAPANEPPHQISGLAFSPVGKQLYVGLEQGGIAKYEIDLLARRTFSAGLLA